jgi:hypothetical protein
MYRRADAGYESVLYFRIGRDLSDAPRSRGATTPMPTTSTIHDDGVAEVVMDPPPDNALTVAGWFEDLAKLQLE